MHTQCISRIYSDNKKVHYFNKTFANSDLDVIMRGLYASLWVVSSVG